MIRVLVFLFAVAAAAWGAVWLAERPGDVVVTWMGWHLETSVMVALAAVTTLVVVVMLAWSFLRGILRAPRALATRRRNRRAARGRLAVTHGLVAIGSGDVNAAKRYAHEAHRLLGEEPLALLLGAQAAQLAGDKGGADRAFRRMAARDDTKLLGLHGLYIEAQRRDDPTTARQAAEEAARAEPSLAWAGQAVLEFRARERDWEGALAALERNYGSGLVDKAQYRRTRAVLLTARALSRDDADRPTAKALVAEAVKLCPGLVPAAALAGRLAAEDGEARRAAKVVEAAWKIEPHPDLAEAYAHLRPGDSARDRLTRIQALAKLSGDHPEGKLAVARAAIDAREFEIARDALAVLAARPTQRYAQLMAELEDAQSGDHGRAREWMGRALIAPRDPSWTADGLVSGKWLPVSPVTGHLDAFEWKVPLADVEPPAVLDAPSMVQPAARVAAPVVTPEPPADVVEVEPEAKPESQPVHAEPKPEAAKPEVIKAEAAKSEAAKPEAAKSEAAKPDAVKSEPEPIMTPPPAPRATPRGDTVIPLIPPPDDPGPEPDDKTEPAGETPQESWKRLKGWFG
jgi:HemY protein